MNDHSLRTEWYTKITVEQLQRIHAIVCTVVASIVTIALRPEATPIAAFPSFKKHNFYQYIGSALILIKSNFKAHSQNVNYLSVCPVLKTNVLKKYCKTSTGN